jgi:hypothetical protein
MINVYVCACWHEWWFGGGFGCRPFVEMMPILALPMAAALSLALARIKVGIVRTMVGLFIGLNVIAMNAYWIGIIPFDGPSWAHALSLQSSLILRL